VTMDRSRLIAGVAKAENDFLKPEETHDFDVALNRPQLSILAAVFFIDSRIFLGIPDSHGTRVWQSPQP